MGEVAEDPPVERSGSGAGRADELLFTACRRVQCVGHGLRRSSVGPAQVEKGRIGAAGGRGTRPDQLGALGLVVNVVVLWNTLYMDEALAHLRRRGVETRPEDVARSGHLR